MVVTRLTQKVYALNHDRIQKTFEMAMAAGGELFICLYLPHNRWCGDDRCTDRALGAHFHARSMHLNALIKRQTMRHVGEHESSIFWSAWDQIAAGFPIYIEQLLPSLGLGPFRSPSCQLKLRQKQNGQIQLTSAYQR